MKKAWTYLNGKKLYIGAALVFGTPPLFELISQPYGILGLTIPGCFPKIQAMMIWAGTAIGTIGAIHKMIKAKIDEADPALASKS